MRVFLTGGSGWAGSAVPELINAGHEVIGLARSEASAGATAAAGAEVMPGGLENLDAGHYVDVVTSRVRPDGVHRRRPERSDERPARREPGRPRDCARSHRAGRRHRHRHRLTST
jgi:hypothetical protein